jgi:hypothetical protein
LRALPGKKKCNFSAHCLRSCAPRAVGFNP